MADLRLGSQGAMQTMPAPKAEGGIRTAWVPVGNRDRNLDGGMSEDRVATKRRWDISWPPLGASDVATVEAQVAKNEVLDFDPMTGGVEVYDVLVVSYQKTARKLASGAYWDVTLSLEEV